MTFDEFQKAMSERSHVIHPVSDGWTISDWFLCLTGELGEAANKYKKYLRGEMTFEEMQLEVGKEIADVQSYLFKLAEALELSLEQVTINKFNEVNKRHGYTKDL